MNCEALNRCFIRLFRPSPPSAASRSSDAFTDHDAAQRTATCYDTGLTAKAVPAFL